MRYDIAITGAGPAGMIAAIRASELGAHVALIEKNAQPGRKLLITGGGRCNLTNDTIALDRLKRIYGRNGAFLYQCVSRFGVAETASFFERIGVPLKVEDGGRIFPKSDRAQDVLAALIRRMNALGVSLLAGVEVTGFARDGSLITGVEHKSGMIDADNFILCTGGRSFPATGSTGEGFGWLRGLGHTITKLSPGLAPVTIVENWLKPAEGVSLSGVRLTVAGVPTDGRPKPKKPLSADGEVMITSTGLSGPLVLELSAGIAELMNEGGASLSIDFLPETTRERLDAELRESLERNGGRMLINCIAGYVPPKLLPVVMEIAGADAELRASKTGKAVRLGLVDALKGMRLTVRGVIGFERAMITRGGLSLSELDPVTMRSKIMDNLFVAGEALDLDGPTGGYNLQICWSTGYMAGEGAAKRGLNK